jgi:hypothetical protein
VKSPGAAIGYAIAIANQSWLRAMQRRLTRRQGPGILATVDLQNLIG